MLAFRLTEKRDCVYKPLENELLILKHLDSGTALQMNKAPNTMKSKPDPILTYRKGTYFEIAMPKTMPSPAKTVNTNMIMPNEVSRGMKSMATVIIDSLFRNR
jgi:hypothetical protein